MSLVTVQYCVLSSHCHSHYSCQLFENKSVSVFICRLVTDQTVRGAFTYDVNHNLANFAPPPFFVNFFGQFAL